MKNYFIVITILLAGLLSAQFNISIEVPENFKAKDATLFTISGSKDIIVSTTKRSGNSWNFKIQNPYIGMMKVYFPEFNNSFNLISENRNISIKLETSVDKVNNVIYLDESNILMEQVLDVQKKNEYIFPALVQIKDYYKDNTEFGKALKNEVERLSKEVIIDRNKNPFVDYYYTNYNKFLVQNSAVKPVGQEEIETFIVTTSDLLETSSLLRPLLVNFLNSGEPSKAENAVQKLLDRLIVETPRGQTVLSELIDLFELYSRNDLKEKYLTQAKNLKCTITERLASTIKSHKNVELGAKFPNYKFNTATNTTSKFLHDVKADKKIVIFWSSSCSHCETEIPKILDKYSTLKSQNIEVIALSLDTDKVSYQNRISSFPWINDSELKGWNSSYVDTYNIHATPTYFILGSDNKILAKPDHVSDVLQYLNLK